MNSAEGFAIQCYSYGKWPYAGLWNRGGSVTRKKPRKLSKCCLSGTGEGV